MELSGLMGKLYAMPAAMLFACTPASRRISSTNHSVSCLSLTVRPSVSRCERTGNTKGRAVGPALRTEKLSIAELS